MKSNFNEIFEGRIEGLLNSRDVDIEKELDEIMPQIIFRGYVTKARMAREIIRQRLTSAMNSKGIYSFEKGHFVWIENADEEQLLHFKEKAERDQEAALKRANRAENLINQISMAWDENGKFIGYHMPEAVNQ